MSSATPAFADSGDNGGGGRPLGPAAGALVLAHTNGHTWGRYRRQHRRALAAVDAHAVDLGRHSPAALACGQRAWAQLAYNEYRAVATMSQVALAMTLAQAPLDLTHTAATFPGEELLHAHLCAGLARRLGGGVDDRWRPGPLRPSPPPIEPRLFARWSHEMVVGNLCVAESISFALLKAALGGARESFSFSVLKILCRDEALHAELGWAYLDWLAPALGEADRAHLGRVARAAVEAYRAVWRPAAEALSAEASAEERELYALCMLTPAAQAEVGERAVEETVRAPLADYGIEI